MTVRVQYPPAATRQTRVSAVMIWLPHMLWTAGLAVFTGAVAGFGVPGIVVAVLTMVTLAIPAYIALHEVGRVRDNRRLLAARAQLIADLAAPAADDTDDETEAGRIVATAEVLR
ncbi:hypothetical protein [Amycolatopsis sp. NPDC054798]